MSHLLDCSGLLDSGGLASPLGRPHPAVGLNTAGHRRTAQDYTGQHRTAQCLVVPGVSTDTCQAEIEHTWATANNLQLNRAKTKDTAGQHRTLQDNRKKLTEL